MRGVDIPSDNNAVPAGKPLSKTLNEQSSSLKVTKVYFSILEDKEITGSLQAIVLNLDIPAKPTVKLYHAYNKKRCA